MALAITGTPRKSRIEQLLSSIEGVITVRVALDRNGDPVEIHVLSPPDLHAKQVVRNVISALTAGLGIEIDRRIISVAQLDASVASEEHLFAGGDENPDAGRAAADPTDDAHSASEADRKPAVESSPDAERGPEAGSSSSGVREQAAEPSPASDLDSESAADWTSATRRGPHPADDRQAPRGSDSGRVVFSGYGTHQDKSRHVTCSVSVRHNGREFTGTGHGPDTPYGRAEASARATLEALTAARSTEEIAFEGIALVETHGRTYVHIAAHAISSRAPTPLVGTAAIKRTTEEAAILATLQAANRRTERGSGAGS